jgi:hypothetical protein
MISPTLAIVLCGIVGLVCGFGVFRHGESNVNRAYFKARPVAPVTLCINLLVGVIVAVVAPSLLAAAVGAVVAGAMLGMLIIGLSR